MGRVQSYDTIFFGVGHPFTSLMKTRVPGFGPWPYGLWPIDPQELLGFFITETKQWP